MGGGRVGRRVARSGSVRKHEGYRPLGRSRIILKWMVNWIVASTELVLLRTGTSDRCC